jgi:hypothetical protein
MPLAFNLHYWSHSHLPRKVLGLLCLFCLLYQGSERGGGGKGPIKKRRKRKDMIYDMNVKVKEKNKKADEVKNTWLHSSGLRLG